MSHLYKSSIPDTTIATCYVVSRIYVGIYTIINLTKENNDFLILQVFARVSSVSAVCSGVLSILFMCHLL